MHEYEIAALRTIKKAGSIDFKELLASAGIEKDKLLWAIENLKASGLVEVEKEDEMRLSLTEEGSGYLKIMPEEELAKAAAEKRMKINESVSNVALSWAKKNGWVEIEEGTIVATEKWKKDSSVPYSQRQALLEVKGGKRPRKEILETLIKRGLVEESIRSGKMTVRITQKGGATNLESEGVGAITREILALGSWKKDGLRPYDINAPSETAYPARLHPLHEMIRSIRETWLSMGFVETEGPIVESSFWNFDTLFSPQDHPTREMQDTFFLSNPKLLDIEDVELLGKVKRMQKKGWKQDFNVDVARQAVLRTHTTSVSARTMRRFSTALQQNYPLKLFSVGRVFRNESIDYKHLAELYMVDGIIIGDNLGLAHLFDVLRTFFTQLGMESIRFKPSYFPFTEPSLEAHYYDERRGAEMEIAGGGIIRQEITKAMGHRQDCAGLGIGIDRPTMLKLGLKSITELYKNDAGWLRNRPALKV